MIIVKNVDVWGFEHAIRGMRNPMNSWYKSDSYLWFLDEQDFNDAKKDGYIGKDCVYQQDMSGGNMLCSFTVGKNDLDLMKRLYKAGTEHRTYARMIQVSMDITAPLYWWKEMDRYAVGKSQVSCSTMHKIAAKEFELSDFSHEHLINFHGEGKFSTMDIIIDDLNWSREKYLETKDKKYWWQLIQLLPSSYDQRRTVCMSYETVFKIIRERTGHKLDEWNVFVEILKSLPYVEEIIDEANNICRVEADSKNES